MINECDICHQQYNTEEEANICMSKGKPDCEFHAGDPVVFPYGTIEDRNYFASKIIEIAYAIKSHVIMALVTVPEEIQHRLGFPSPSAVMGKDLKKFSALSKVDPSDKS